MPKVATVIFLLVIASAPLCASVIDTSPSWDGFTKVSNFGIASGSRATYGQTISVSAPDSILDSFSIFVKIPSTLAFGGYVYAWDGFKATGIPLFQSTQRSTTGAASFEDIVFNTGSLHLIPGASYVLFASVSAFAAGHSGTGDWAQPQNQDIYNGGLFVWLNNSSDTSLWTSQNWIQGYLGVGADITFKAIFSSTAPPPALPSAIPEPPTVLVGFALAGLLSIRAKRH
ncbi:MAG: hypothetical protein EXQ52_17790 [Bryobacterales bacterium]|nr:hypothetical protein [Bryobacterales bacterium]